jgi:hypothetical protein
MLYLFILIAHLPELEKQSLGWKNIFPKKNANYI